MGEVVVLGREAVFAAVDAAAAIAAVRDAFVRHRRGEWTMPSKVYLPVPGRGDFRAMPALGGELAMLKWISSFPANAADGVATVQGVVCLSDAHTSAPVALLDASAVTALRTGAVAAVAAGALAARGARSVGVIGCGVNGAWAARCLAAAGHGPGVCADPRADAARTLAEELGWRVAETAEALDADIVCCVTPGAEPLVTEQTLRPGQHLTMLGADGPGKAEATVDAVVRCSLFCDEWDQASHGGELTGAIAAGRVAREDVTELGAVLTGEAPGRGDEDAITLFDSTGLAIQDLAVAALALRAARDGRVATQTLEL